MNNHNDLQYMTDLQLEAIAGDESHDLNELANEILTERISAASDSQVAQALGYTGNQDFFSIRGA